MPLKPGRGPATIRTNITRELAAGKPRKQAIAIAMATARKAKGGRRGHS